MIKFEQHFFELRNYLQIRQVCEVAIEYSRFYIISGETGTGKTEALVRFSHRNSENIKYIRLRKTMTTTNFFSELAVLYGYRYSNTRFYNSLNWIKNFVNQNDQKQLLIIDEGGRFTPEQLGFIHELRDLTVNNLGIVMAGPSYFVEDLEVWMKAKKRGVPEFFRRVNHVIPLQDLTKEEIIGVCKAYDITSMKEINRNFIEIKNIGYLTNTIENFKFYSQKLIV